MTNTPPYQAMLVPTHSSVSMEAIDTLQPRPANADLPPKTSGERFYDGFQFVFGKASILAATAGLAFIADQKYGPDTITGMPNALKKFQGWFHQKLFHNHVYPLSEKGDAAQLIGKGMVGTVVLSHGGTFFAPMVKELENNREQISNWYNQQFGTPQEVADAHARLKDTPKLDWADVGKGRAVAIASMFASMMTAYVAIGKDNQSNRYWLDVYEDKFARMTAGITQAGKEIAATPITMELTELQQANKAYRLGKVVALDIYATTASLIIWNMVSRMSAKHRDDHEKLAAYQGANISIPEQKSQAPLLLSETMPGEEVPSKELHSKEVPSETVVAPAIEASAATASIAPPVAQQAQQDTMVDRYHHAADQTNMPMLHRQ